MTFTYPAVTFERHVATDHGTAARRLRQWAEEHAQTVRLDGTVEVDVGRRHMQLEIQPWSSAGEGAVLVLRPLRTVRPSARYFRAGHAFLDDLAAELASPELTLAA